MDRATRDRVLIMNGLPLDFYLAACSGTCALSALASGEPWLWWVTGTLTVITGLIAAAMRLW